MSIRSVEELSDALSRELAWRRIEMTAFAGSIDAASGNASRHTALLRAGVALLYAHWEGFVRAASSSYMEFVALQRLRNSELAPAFLAAAMKRMLKTAAETEQAKMHIEVVSFFATRLSERSQVPYKAYRNAFARRNNITAAELEDILASLGIDSGPYETRRQLLTKLLVERRNAIAHGEYLVVDAAGFTELRHKVFETMVMLEADIVNAASLGRFRAA
jgi:hypothetical protein